MFDSIPLSAAGTFFAWVIGAYAAGTAVAWYCWARMLAAYRKQLLDFAAPLKPAPALRLWRLGSLEHRLYPTEEAVRRLAESLLAANANGPSDLIWGPEVDVQTLEGCGGVQVISGPGLKLEPVGGNVYKVVQEGPPPADEAPALPAEEPPLPHSSSPYGFH